MTWYFWLLVGLFGAAVAWMAWGVYYEDEVPLVAGFSTLALAGAICWMLLVHFVPNEPDTPSPPSRTCVVQQLERVSHGKTSSDEWVCIGWAK